MMRCFPLTTKMLLLQLEAQQRLYQYLLQHAGFYSPQIGNPLSFGGMLERDHSSPQKGVTKSRGFGRNPRSSACHSQSVCAASTLPLHGGLHMMVQ
jgi:hypothetical protein